MRRIGIIDYTPMWEPLRDALREFGYVEGQNIAFEYRSAASKPERLSAEGANSFTEKQAKDRVLAHGYRNVSPLQQDADGIWRGTAELNGIEVNVAIDCRGNVVSKYR
jgi:hypothetical protein